MSTSDLKLLMTAEQAHQGMHHWMVAFTVRVHDSILSNLKAQIEPCQGCGGECETDEEIATISDTVTVAGGDDAGPAVTRVREYVLGETRHGIKLDPESFKLKGVKLLSVQEI